MSLLLLLRNSLGPFFSPELGPTVLSASSVEILLPRAQVHDGIVHGV